MLPTRPWMHFCVNGSRAESAFEPPFKDLRLLATRKSFAWASHWMSTRVPKQKTITWLSSTNVNALNSVDGTPRGY
jgi:hypothetical protein